MASGPPPPAARWLVESLSKTVANDVRMRAAFRRVTRRWRHSEHTIRRGAAAGLKINLCGSRPSYVIGSAEQDVQDLLGAWLRPGSVYYDLGANVGFLTLVGARLVGSAGHVYAFEPSPGTAAALRSNVLRNGLTNVTVIEAAVGATSGTARFDPVDEEASQLATLLDPAQEGGVEVQVVAIDDFVRDGARPPDVVKIDVEGAEDAAIAGMRETLAARTPSVVCEIHQTLHADEHPAEVLLRQAGLTVSWLEPELRATREARCWAPHVVAVPAAGR